MRDVIVFFLIGVIAVSVVVWWKVNDNRRIQKDWDYSVQLSKEKKISCENGLSFVLVQPPADIDRARVPPRIVLLGEEIDARKLDKVKITPGSGGFKVEYEGKTLGFCPNH